MAGLRSVPEPTLSNRSISNALIAQQGLAMRHGASRRRSVRRAMLSGFWPRWTFAESTAPSQSARTVRASSVAGTSERTLPSRCPSARHWESASVHWRHSCDKSWRKASSCASSAVKLPIRQPSSSAEIEISFVDFAAILFGFGHTCCGSFASFLVRNRCGPQSQLRVRIFPRVPGVRPPYSPQRRRSPSTCGKNAVGQGEDKDVRWQS